jgi:hypothetical protein
MRSPSKITHRRPSQGPGATERSWQAGDRIAFAGDGSELAEIERQKRAAKPWLYEAESIGNMLPVGADRLARMAPIGVPLAVKIGVRKPHPRLAAGLFAKTVIRPRPVHGSSRRLYAATTPAGDAGHLK